MKIHDTLSNAEKIQDPDKIRIYLCGVTVYDESHIGHARTIIVFDVLRRYLERAGVKVELVQNFTDVDDKIISRADKEGVPAKEISDRYIQDYFDDFDRLYVKRATAYPKATEHIEDIILFIKQMIEKKAAYVAKNGVYFSVTRFPEYGKLSKKNIKQLQSGARVEVDESKADPLDFAVWKFSDSEPTWDSPWGKGRPGWHIECSAMSAKYLGANFEIHGGGRDLIFPHHENEIAQSESCTGIPLAKTWMHVGMVTTGGEKMSKSLGNIVTIKQALEDWGPNITRLFCLSGHYSKPIDYSEELFRENLTKWRQAEICLYEMIHADRQKHTEGIKEMIQERAQEFDSALERDFNTHMALSSFFLLVRQTNKTAAECGLGTDDAKTIRKEFDRMLHILGLRMHEATSTEKSEIETLISDRKRLRQEKKFEDADKIRDKLNTMNVETVDHKDKTIWVKKERIKSDV